MTVWLQIQKFKSKRNVNVQKTFISFFDHNEATLYAGKFPLKSSTSANYFVPKLHEP